jgi:hypothetical protein
VIRAAAALLTGRGHTASSREPRHRHSGGRATSPSMSGRGHRSALSPCRPAPGRPAARSPRGRDVIKPLLCLVVRSSRPRQIPTPTSPVERSMASLSPTPNFHDARIASFPCSHSGSGARSDPRPKSRTRQRSRVILPIVGSAVPVSAASSRRCDTSRVAGDRPARGLVDVQVELASCHHRLRFPLRRKVDRVPRCSPG